MKFYFDESGDFRLDDDGVYRVGIVVGIAIPESEETQLFAQFDEFVTTLSRQAFKRGEPKGSRFTSQERRHFAEMIASNPAAVVTPATLDLASIIRAKKQVRCDVVNRMRQLAEKCTYETMRGQVHLLADQFKNLSDQQALRLGSLAYCLMRSFEHAAIALSGRDFLDCWHQMRFEIDPVAVRPGNREQIVFNRAMLGWIQAWSQKNPIVTTAEIHTQDHPLIKNYSATNDTYDLNRIYRDNLHYRRSSESKGLQIADMAASIVHQAVCRIVTFDDLTNYGLLLKNSFWPPKYAHGLFCFTDPSEVDYSRYEGLTEAVAKVRGGEQWREIVRNRFRNERYR